MRRLLLVFLVALILLSLFGCRKSSEPDWKLQIITLDVGQGSSTLIRTVEGDILIDAGPELSQPSLCRRLDALGVERLELLILTHPDEDHIGGADGILEQFEVGAVWTNGVVAECDGYERLTDALQRSGATSVVAKKGDGYSLGDLGVTVLSAVSEASAQDNEGSLVLLLRCGSFGGLMMGDASQKVEQALIDEYGSAHLDVDVLWVGHHGANNASSTVLLEAVSAKYAVISCGAGNLYGHPDGRALARLDSAEVEVLRTDLLGEIRIEVHENEIRLIADENKGKNE